MSQEKFDIKILIVEDDEPSRFFLARLISYITDSYVVAANGKEGLEIYEKEKPQLVITDVSMPVMNGILMSKKIRQINPDAEIILATAFDDKNTLLSAIEIGVRDFIQKPIHKDALISSITRIYEQFKLKRQVQQQFERINVLSRAIEQSSSMVFITDPEGNIEYANNTFYDVTGFDESETISKSIHSLFMNESQPDNFVNYKNALKKKQHWRGELQGIKKSDKNKFWAMTSISPIISKSGNINNIVQVNEDITDLKKIQQEISEHNAKLDAKVKERTKELQALNQNLLNEIEERKKIETELIIAKETAEKANKAKGNFLAKVSHELRTPMNGIIGMTGFLAETKLDDKQHYYVDIVKKSADALLLIINDILDISKIESGKFKLEKENFYPASLIDDVFNIIKPKNIQNIDLIKEIDSKIPNKLYGDPYRLQQVLLNLISNALKFTEKGFVKISVELKNENNNNVELLFSVKDTGIGIGDSDKSKLFKMFSQVEQTMTRKHGGTGLGLVISKEIIEMMDGEIWFDSVLGEGSTFYFSVNFSKEKKIKTVTASEYPKYSELVSEIKSILKEKKILIVDDSKINRQVLSISLEELNVHYDQAENGKIAVELCNKTKYDIILMDLQMPEIDGLTATDYIRKNNDSAKIIAVTAHSDENHRNEAYQHNMNAVLVKPYTKDKLYKALYDVFKNQKYVDAFQISEDFNFASLLNSIGYNEKIFAQIIEYFIKNHEEVINNLKNHTVNNDYSSLMRLAHKYKSELGHFKPARAIELLKLIEHDAKHKINDDMIELINVLSIEVEKLVEFFNSNDVKDIINYYKGQK